MKRIRVVAGLFSRGDAVLVQQRPAHKSRGLLWEFPGGKVEEGESDRSALVRECAEELGVEVTVGDRLWEASHRYPDLEVELRLYAATLSEGAEPRALEAEQIAWIPRRDLSSLPFCEADLPLLPLLAEGRLGAAC